MESCPQSKEMLEDAQDHQKLQLEVLELLLHHGANSNEIYAPVRAQAFNVQQKHDANTIRSNGPTSVLHVLYMEVLCQC